MADKCHNFEEKKIKIYLDKIGVNLVVWFHVKKELVSQIRLKRVAALPDLVLQDTHLG